ncbi:MAG: carboxypeptidase regulatory-like domain-containing protein [Candidatus Binatia bacterium]
MALALGAASAAPAVDVGGRVVDAAGQPLRDAVVFVEALPDGAPPPAAPTPVVMDQINKEFVPRLLPVVVGTEVAFPNHDQIHHHVYSLSRTKTFEIPLYKGEAASPVRFDQPGAVKVGCNIHDWMAGVILVLPTPYFAVSDEQGAFTLKDLPPGTYALTAWHEGAKTGVEATRQRVAVGEGTAPLAFTVDAVPRKTRPRGRSYE